MVLDLSILEFRISGVNPPGIKQDKLLVWLAHDSAEKNNPSQAV
jgi:hypothetical protein